MATRIEAIIFDGDPDTLSLPMGLQAVPLAGELTMLPVTAEVVSGLDPDAIGDERIPGNWNLQQPVAALARALSHDRRVVYFFSETWAGPSIRESIAWRAGQLLYGPSGTCDIEADLEPGYQLVAGDNAVNAGLRAIGVLATDGRDEYLTVGLDKHRMTETGSAEQELKGLRRTHLPLVVCLVVLSHEFDLSDDAGAECWKVFRGDPVFEDGLAAEAATSASLRTQPELAHQGRSDATA